MACVYGTLTLLCNVRTCKIWRFERFISTQCCFNPPAYSSVEARPDVVSCTNSKLGASLCMWSEACAIFHLRHTKARTFSPHIHMHRYVTDSKKSILYCSKPAWSRIYLLFNIGHCEYDNRQSWILVHGAGLVWYVCTLNTNVNINHCLHLFCDTTTDNSIRLPCVN